MRTNSLSSVPFTWTALISHNTSNHPSHYSPCWCCGRNFKCDQQWAWDYSLFIKEVIWRSFKYIYLRYSFLITYNMTSCAFNFYVFIQTNRPWGYKQAFHLYYFLASIFSLCFHFDPFLSKFGGPILKECGLGCNQVKSMFSHWKHGNSNECNPS